jgi:hypothetical protein
MKPGTRTTRAHDGTWWPRSRDLTAELPALSEALESRVGRMRRVVFSLDTWDDVARRVQVDGELVRLEGFRSQDEHRVAVIGSDRSRVDLLVVLPGESAEADGGNTAERSAAD